MRNGKGIAIDDDLVKLAVKSEFHGPKGNINILFGNKSDYAMTQMRIVIPIFDELKIEYSQISPLVTPNNQIQQLLKVTCNAPFSKEVECAIYFEHEKKIISL